MDRLREAAEHPWTCLFTAFLHYLIFTLVDYLVKIGLSFARNDDQRRRLWRYEALLIGALAILVYVVTNNVPVVLITLACATYLSSQGMTLMQGLLALLLFVYGVLQTVAEWISRSLEGWQPAVDRSIAYVSARYQPALESRSVDGDNSRDYSLPDPHPESSSLSAAVPYAYDTMSLNHRLQNEPSKPQPYLPSEMQSSTRCYAVGGQKMFNDYRDCSYRAFQDEQLRDPRSSGALACRKSSSERNLATFGGQVVDFLCNNIPGLGKRPRGLYNNGRNLCFMNSVLQCLARTPHFPRELNSALGATEGLIKVNSRPERPLAVAVAHLVMDLLVPDGITISQNKFRCLASRLNDTLIAPPESDCRQAQQDAAEFIMWLLAIIHTALNVPNNSRNLLNLQPNLNTENSTLDIKQALHTMRQGLLEQIRHTQTLDGQELLIPLQSLSDLEWALYTISNQSLIDKMFTGQLAELHQCLACNRISVHIDTFTVLPVVVPSARHCTLEECMNLFHNIEPLEGKNGLKCECRNPSPRIAQSPNSSDSGYISMDSKNTPAPSTSRLTLTEGRKRTILCRLPEYLIIQLMRFRFDRVRRLCSKIHTPVVMNPNCLDLTHYALNSTYFNQHNPAYQFAYRYQMYGLCLHQGGENTSYGHYIAYAPGFDGNWYHLEDEEVFREHDFESTLATKPVQENAYILFYHLKK